MHNSDLILHSFVTQDGLYDGQQMSITVNNSILWAIIMNYIILMVYGWGIQHEYYLNDLS